MFQTQQFQLEQKSLTLGLDLIGTPSLKYGGVSFIDCESLMDKRCCKCKQVKIINHFSKDRSRKDGLRNICKECDKKYKKEFRLNNRDSIREYDKKYRLKNLDRIRKRARKNRLAHPERNRNDVGIRRSRKLSNGVFKISSKELKNLYSSPCFYCGSTDSIQADHVIPVVKGGVHSIGNLVPACAKCNLSKGSKFLIEWKRDLTFLKKDGRVY
jgi:5-methylcytosine-specific restriction endonuclease McrA